MKKQLSMLNIKTTGEGADTKSRVGVVKTAVSEKRQKSLLPKIFSPTVIQVFNPNRIGFLNLQLKPFEWPATKK